MPMTMFLQGLIVLAAGAVDGAASRPIPADEPPPPALGKRAMECQAPVELPSADHLKLRCFARPKLPVVTVLVHYRHTGTEDFTLAPTLRSAKGWYTATLCPHAFAAGALHYYVEALDVNGKLVATVGDEESPGVVRILPPVAPAKPGATPGGQPGTPAGPRDDDPLETLRASREAAREAAIADERARPRRVPGSFYAGFGAGLGYGWYPARVLEYRQDISVAPGGGLAGPLVLTPEVGYQLSSRWAVSLLARWELIASTGAGDARRGAPATRALAVLGRVSHHWGSGRAQLVASGMLGAGEGVRMVVPPTQASDVRLERNDTVRGGPVLVGPGAGFLFHVNPHLALVGELRALAALPTVAAVVDLNAGVQLGF
jgi:hypothetical protein